MNDSSGRRGKLGPVLATLLVAGNMIGSGVYLLPATLGAVGSVSLIGWFAAAAGALLLAAVFSALAALRPQTDGVVGYATEGLGGLIGAQTAWAYWIACWVGNAAIALAATGYLTFFVPALGSPAATLAATVGVIWLLTLANLFGPRFVGKLHGATLAIGLVPVLLAGLLGWAWFDPAVFTASWNVTGGSATAAIPAAAVSAFWAFLGMESAAVVARSVRDPARNVPIATLGGVGLAAVVYVLACTAIMGVLPAGALATSSAPFAAVAAKVVGGAAAAVIAACALLKATGTLGGWVLVTAETQRATAAAGFLPRWLAPDSEGAARLRNVLVTGALMSLAAAASTAPTLAEQFGVLINVVVVLSLVVYAWCCAALWRFGGARSRLLAAAGLLFCVWLILASGRELVLITAACLAASVPLYLLVDARRRRALTDSAAGPS